MTPSEAAEHWRALAAKLRAEKERARPVIEAARRVLDEDRWGLVQGRDWEYEGEVYVVHYPRAEDLDALRAALLALDGGKEVSCG